MVDLPRNGGPLEISQAHGASEMRESDDDEFSIECRQGNVFRNKGQSVDSDTRKTNTNQKVRDMSEELSSSESLDVWYHLLKNSRATGVCSYATKARSTKHHASNA